MEGTWALAPAFATNVQRTVIASLVNVALRETVRVLARRVQSAGRRVIVTSPHRI